MKTACFCAVTAIAIGACANGTSGGGVPVTEIAPAATPEEDAAPADASPDVAKNADADAAKAGECAAQATQDACVTCCTNAHNAGAMGYMNALIDCMCESANCASACSATLCNQASPQNPDAACNTCVQSKTSACAPHIQQSCDLEPDCVLFMMCVNDSHCTSK
jgi:hypothetical protein